MCGELSHTMAKGGVNDKFMGDQVIQRYVRK